MAVVTQQLIDDLRSSYETRLQQEAPPPDVGSFHPNDLERLKDDDYLRRFLEHHDCDVKLATDMIFEMLTWRKTYGANEITEENINMDYILEGAFFVRGRDINGRRLLIFKTAKHKKGVRDIESLKRCIVYWFDRLERSEPNTQITVFFDMEGAGLSNMDMDLIKYLISILKLYYPYYLNYIIIYEMPWILNAAFKVIKQLLPAKAVARMRFLNKANLKEIVPPDQALKSWGGEDDYEFKFEPEVRTAVAPTSNESAIKKVTFAEPDQINNDSGDNRNGNMIALNPPANITFNKNGNDITSTFSIMNNESSLITYKIKTTSPEKFRVRPNIGTLAAGVSQIINVVIQQGYQAPPAFGSDKFLVMCMPLSDPNATAAALAEMWKTAPAERVEQHRLRCAIQNSEVTRNGIIRPNNLADGDKQTMHISQSLTDLKEAHQLMRKEIRTLKMLTAVTLSMTLIIVMVMFYLFQGNVSNLCIQGIKE